MKNLSLVLNAILFLLVIGLYVLHFSGNSSTPSQEEESAQPASRSAADSESVSIAYINTDSLFQNYKLYADLAADLQKKQEKVGKQLASRGQKLEQEFISAQKRAKAGLMSNNEMRSSEQNLMQKQQELESYRQTVSEGLIEEESVMSQKLNESINSFLEEYNKEKKFTMILKNATFWIADDYLDITQEVLDGLNAKYEAEGNADSSAE